MGQATLRQDEIIHHLRFWTYRRQLLGHSGSALSALQRVIKVYSSHPTAPLSLIGCSASMTTNEFTALEQTRQVIRVPGMRGSDFLVPVEMAPHVFAATLLLIEKHAVRFAVAGISMNEYEALKLLIVQGGRAIASWSHRFTGDWMQVTISPFEPGPLPDALNEGSFTGIGALLGTKNIELLG